VRRNHFGTNDAGTRLATTATSCHISIIVHYFDFLIVTAIRGDRMS